MTYPLDPDEFTEDLSALLEPYFQLDPFEGWELDLEYMQGEM